MPAIITGVSREMDQAVPIKYLTFQLTESSDKELYISQVRVITVHWSKCTPIDWTPCRVVHTLFSLTPHIYLASVYRVSSITVSCQLPLLIGQR